MATVAEAAGTVQMHHTLFADAVKQVSALAQAKLPESLHGRIQRATALVLDGGVFVEEDGTTTQVRCTNGFYPVNGHCPCPDHARAQEGYWLSGSIGDHVILTMISNATGKPDRTPSSIYQVEEVPG